MSNYYIGADGYWISEREYLQHWGTGRAHKYIMKIGEGAKARYLYTKAEVDAYLRATRSNNAAVKEQKQKFKESTKNVSNIEKTHKKEINKANRELSSLERQEKRDTRRLDRLFKNGFSPTANNRIEQKSTSKQTKKYLALMKNALDRKRSKNAIFESIKEIDSKYSKEIARGRKIMSDSKNRLVKTKEIASKNNREALKTMLHNIFNGPRSGIYINDRNSKDQSSKKNTSANSGAYDKYGNSLDKPSSNNGKDKNNNPINSTNKNNGKDKNDKKINK